MLQSGGRSVGSGTKEACSAPGFTTSILSDFGLNFLLLQL